ncbi:ariadne RING finger [Aspergillus bombycis]|uniref:Ariadne RING finger n=1 Tax=Aspergillus bombycis TaxID=109264 RepID=A0A1F7ZSK4_9EURO|nr:ariadne RING finger [Aspergillus bombycis]OGM42397.1 ariadne RING finger [Aspergillus bombycis]
MTGEHDIEPPQANTNYTIVALLQQIEEIDLFRDKQKGKGRADELLDIDIAMAAFRDEVQIHIGVSNDLKLTQSMGNAVYMDGPAIAGITQGEVQAQRDRQMAMAMSADDPERQNPPQRNLHSQSHPLHLPRGFNEEGDVDRGSDEDKGGPSKTYAERQEEAMEKLTRQKQQCCTCFDSFQLSDIVRLECNDLYCTDCFKSLFMRATKDEQLFPPRCCRQHIPISLIAEEMTTKERDSFQTATVEFATISRTYCSNTDCGRFIVPNNILAHQAKCEYCGSSTCTMCKNTFHNDDCPEDIAVQETMELARSQGWQRCVSCNAMVELTIGCYHMTYDLFQSWALVSFLQQC